MPARSAGWVGQVCAGCVACVHGRVGEGRVREGSAWRLVLDFSSFFFGPFSNTQQPRNSTRVYRVLRGLQRRISVYADCTPDEPARVVKPHRKHAHDTTGEVRGEFQLRRVRAFAALETTPRYVNVRVVFSRG